MSTNDKNFVDRMPHSIEAERAVIGCLLQNNEKIDEALSILDPQMFYDPIFKAMFKSIDELWKNVKKDKDYKVDKVALRDKTIAKAMGYSLSDVVKNIRDRVKEEGFDAERLDDDFFAEILRTTPITSNVLTYCNIVKEKYILRKSIELCENTIIDCRQGQKSAEDICNNAQNEFFKYSKASTQKDYMRLGLAFNDTIDEVVAASKTVDGITGLHSGYELLDKTLKGFQKGTVNILAGRTGTGKTAFALNIAYNVATKEHKKVLYFSLEMGYKELLKRVLSIETEVENEKISSGRLNDEEWQQLINGGRIIHDKDIFVDIDPDTSITQIRNKCQKLKQEEGLDMVVIDYIGLIRIDTSQGIPRSQQIGEISRNLKIMAKDLDIPVLVLCQLNREAEDGEPMLSQLRDSGSIEQDADVVMLLYTKKEENNDDPNRIQCNVAKNRHGQTNNIPLKFDHSMYKFFDIGFEP